METCHKRKSTDNCTSEPEVVVESTTKPERKKKDRDTHLDASNPKGTMLFFSFLPSFFLFFHNYSPEDK
jgi:threonine/homoserine/homoserine lactone efflux protein